MLQNRIDELDSAILDIKGELVFVTGFMREEMVELHLIKGKDCWSSKGLYDYQELEYHNIKNNALIIVRENGKEINRYQYKPVYKDTIQYKNKNGKNLSITFTIRKSSFSEHYHLLSDRTSIIFDRKDELDNYLLDEYGIRCTYN
ncbi:hypothetical protein GMD78_07380 [Ornithinibacillus sp. L9]|uniref:Uncharacterized protein n=1 Tax=Ornithinibacillus caprae TaxID=2678566 RepID=A0A6N8FEU3_9BACI|nr:hypothetical protein [Ornithinibacillus caprae]MUK88212.1 hypothetical protein [Ornithinibacillus caprae]